MVEFGYLMNPLSMLDGLSSQNSSCIQCHDEILFRVSSWDFLGIHVGRKLKVSSTEPLHISAWWDGTLPQSVRCKRVTQNWTKKNHYIFKCKRNDLFSSHIEKLKNNMATKSAHCLNLKNSDDMLINAQMALTYTFWIYGFSNQSRALKILLEK